MDPRLIVMLLIIAAVAVWLVALYFSEREPPLLSDEVTGFPIEGGIIRLPIKTDWELVVLPDPPPVAHWIRRYNESVEHEKRMRAMG